MGRVVRIGSWRIPRLALWAVGLAVAVLVIPAVTFMVRERPWEMRGSGTPAVARSLPVRGVNLVYTVREVLDVAYADETSFVPRPTKAAVSSYLEVVAPAHGGGLWLVHHPPDNGAVPVVRRLRADGSVAAAFETTLGATLFTPSPAGDLWVDVAMGAGTSERIVRYDASGRVVRVYDLPPGFLARAITFDPEGGVWALSEEWGVDPESKQVHLNQVLVPVALPQTMDPPAVPLSLALEGAFFGADGLLYRVRSDGAIEPGNATPAFTVTSWTKAGEQVATYRLPADVRPFAADASGRLYAEERRPERAVARGVSTLGDPADECATLWVVERDGTVTKIPVLWQDVFTGWPPIAWPRPDGTVVTTVVDGTRLRVLELVPGERVRVEADAPFEPDLTLIEPNEPLSGDPYAASDDAERDLMRLVYSGLVSHDASLEPVPDIAVRVPSKENGLVSPDGLEVRWEIRDGIRWHDGTPVTAADVVATYRYLRDHAYLPHGRPFPGFDAIEDVKAEGGQVVVRLREPVGVAPESFFPYVLPAHALPATTTVNPPLFAAPIGCGPYRLVRWEDGSGWYLAAWREGSRQPGAVERVHVVFAHGERALEIHRSTYGPVVWDWVDEERVAELRKSGVVAREFATGRWWGVLLNPRSEPTTERDVRRAIVAAHPREALVSNVFPPSETSVPVDPYPPVADAHDPSRSGVHGDDLDAIPRLLTSLGWQRTLDEKLGRSVWMRAGDRLEVQGSSTHRQWNDTEIPLEAMDTIQLRWREVGFFDGYDPASKRHYASWWRRGALASGEYGAGLGVFPCTPDPGWGGVFDPSDVPSAANPYGIGVAAPRDATLASLYARARAEYDPRKRAELGRAITRRAIDELALAIPERYEMRRVVISGGLTGFDARALPSGAFSDVSDWAVEGVRR